MIDESRINFLKEEISKKIVRDYDKSYTNNNPIDRMRKEIELIESGCSVENTHEGLLVNNKYVVAVRKNRWKVAGKNVWYWYSDIPTFVKKYVETKAIEEGQWIK